MKYFALSFALVVAFSAIAAAQQSSVVNTPFPQQAQASAMAVPDPVLKFNENSVALIELHSPRYFVSALLVVHCRKVEALVLIDDKGEQHPYHGKDATLAQVLAMLSPVPADKITQVTITCPGELGL